MKFQTLFVAPEKMHIQILFLKKKKKIYTPKHVVGTVVTHKKCLCIGYVFVEELEMCQYDTDAPAQGHPHPHAGILQEIQLKKEP